MIDNPQFYEGQHVFVDLPIGEIYGAVVGVASRHIIDMWIVKVLTVKDGQLLEEHDYHFSCFVAPGSLIRDANGVMEERRLLWLEDRKKNDE